MQAAMRNRIIFILIIVSMITAPVAAATSRQPACAAPQCCCQLADAHRGGRLSMGHSACGCQSTPFNACHIEATPYVPLLALNGATDRGKNPKYFFVFDTINRKAGMLLPNALPMTPRSLEVDPTRPSTYLIDCVLII